MQEEQRHINKELIPILEKVYDPEIPVLSVIDMGVIQSATITGKVAQIVLIPTYSGCPAMDAIEDDIKVALKNAGYDAKVALVYTPAWTTDLITKEGRKNLEKYGIAAPLEPNADKEVLFQDVKRVKCPRCTSVNTKLVSQFGSTACKALFQCGDCLEPFDYFKCLK